MPESPFTVAAQDAGTVEHQDIAGELLLGIGVDLDKTVRIDMQSKLDREFGLIDRRYTLNECPSGCRALHVELDSVSGHASPRKLASCRSSVRMPSTA